MIMGVNVLMSSWVSKDDGSQCGYELLSKTLLLFPLESGKAQIWIPTSWQCLIQFKQDVEIRKPPKLQECLDAGPNITIWNTFMVQNLDWFQPKSYKPFLQMTAGLDPCWQEMVANFSTESPPARCYKYTRPVYLTSAPEMKYDSCCWLCSCDKCCTTYVG